jgi:ubiquinone/menaquinone biosynthesis C-methylase UbiE
MNEWSVQLKGKDPEEFDSFIESKTAPNEIQLRNKLISLLRDQILIQKPSYLLDVATGRGMFATKIIDNLPPHTHLICTDLSPTILFSDQYKLKKRNPKVKISYISCDASNLPFVTNSIDCIVSFFGIANMGSVISSAMHEINRVLSDNGIFFDCNILIKNNSPSYIAMKEFFDNREETYPLAYLDKEKFKEYHIQHHFHGEYFSAGSSIGLKNELDLIPMEGDWFEIGMFKGKKEGIS